MSLVSATRSLGDVVCLFGAYAPLPSLADTIKIYTRAHGSKTSNLIINLDHSDWILDDGDKKLIDCGCGESCC